MFQIFQILTLLTNLSLSMINLIIERTFSKAGLLIWVNTEIDLIDGNNYLLKALIIVLIIAIFGYTAKMFYERVIRK